MKKIATLEAPAAIGPYSQAVLVNQMVYTSGQIPINPENGEIVKGGIKEQAKQVMENLGAVLKAAGSSFDKAVKTTCFLTDMDDFSSFNAVYETYFTQKPARSCVAVSRLPKDVLCEIEVIAML